MSSFDELVRRWRTEDFEEALREAIEGLRHVGYTSDPDILPPEVVLERIKRELKIDGGISFEELKEIYTNPALSNSRRLLYLRCILQRLEVNRALYAPTFIKKLDERILVV